VPDADHGSNFVMKLDERTLPTGYRVTTENPRDVRLTRGKMTKLNFGATIHKVVRVDMRANAFDAGSNTLNATWLKQLEALPERMRTEPVILRLGYAAAAGEDNELARRRIAHVSHFMKQLWEEKKCAYPLQIEEEVTLPASPSAGGKQ
jgi:large repetitive protein